MKKLKDCKWEVFIKEEVYYAGVGGSRYRFQVDLKEDCGLTNYLLYGKTYRSRQSAKNNFRQFAKLNGIKKYKFI